MLKRHNVKKVYQDDLVKISNFCIRINKIVSSNDYDLYLSLTIQQWCPLLCGMKHSSVLLLVDN